MQEYSHPGHNIISIQKANKMTTTNKISFEAQLVYPTCNKVSKFKNLLVNKCMKVTFAESLVNECKELLDCIECTKLLSLICNKSPLCPYCYCRIPYSLITSSNNHNHQ